MTVDGEETNGTKNDGHGFFFLGGAVLVAVVGAGIGLFLAFNVANAELQKALFNNSISLIFVALLGGMVGLLIKYYTKLQEQNERKAEREREQRENQALFIKNILADLKAVYDRVERARSVIAAHQSAKTYGLEMRALISARVKLKNITRALDTGTSDIDNKKQFNRITAAVNAMEAYLEGLTHAFVRDYRKASSLQSIFEKEREQAIAQSSKGASGAEQKVMTNKAWEFICETPEIKGFLGKALLNPDSIIAKDEKINYEEQFIAPLDLASWALRNELLFVYGRKRAGLPPEHKCTFVSLSKKTQ